MLSYLKKSALGVCLALVLPGCATQQISGPTGLIEGERAAGGPLVDCRGYFAQAGQEIKASLTALQGPGVGVGIGSSPLLALDSITGDMIVHYQRYCHQYNIGLISREEFLRKTDMLHATQTMVRALVGTVAQPLPMQPFPITSPPGMGPSMDPGFPPTPGVGHPEQTNRSFDIAERIFRAILDAMRPAPGAGGLPQGPSGPYPSYPPPGSYPRPSVPTLTLPPAPLGSPPAPYEKEVGLSLEGLFASIVEDLGQIAREQGRMQEPVRAVLGEISYRSSDFGSPLSLFIKKQLRDHLSRSRTFVLLDTPRLRGVGGITPTRPKAVTALADVAGADAVINGNYWDTPEGIALYVSLRQREGEVPLGGPRVLLPSAVLPQNLAPVPANMQEARLNELIEDQVAPLSVAHTPSPLKVEVWTDRGRGGIYSEGEELVVMVRVNQDAYLRLYYTDASNQTYQIFPNQYRPDTRIRAGAVLTIPGPEDRFAFQVKAPFGAESIIALASPKPFGSAEHTTITTGPFQRVSQGVRGLAVVASSGGEGQVVRDRADLTTVGRQ